MKVLFKLSKFGSFEIVSQAAHGSNRLAWVFAAFAVSCIWASRPCGGQIAVEAYVPNFSSNNVSVIDTKANTVVGSAIPVGSNPIGVAVTPDGRFAYADGFRSKTCSCSIISTSKSLEAETKSCRPRAQIAEGSRQSRRKARIVMIL